MSETVRLAKRVAEVFHCSRTEATQYIEGGNVTVNGVVVEESGFRIAPDAQLALAPNATLAPIEPVTILLHKPAALSFDAAARLVEPANRAADDRSGVQFLKRHTTGLEMLDALENAAGGLLVFSQDWRIRRKLVDDIARVEQEYVVEVSGQMIADGLTLLNQSVVFNGKPVAALKVSWQNETRLRFAFKGGSSRLIAFVCEKVGLGVVSVKRIRIGRVPLAGLAAGQWRYLLGYEQF